MRRRNLSTASARPISAAKQRQADARSEEIPTLRPTSRFRAHDEDEDSARQARSTSRRSGIY